MFLGLRYQKKSYDENSPDPKSPISKIKVEDLVDWDIIGNWNIK